MITADLVRYFLDKEAASSLGFGGDSSSGFDEDAKALGGRGGMSGGLKVFPPAQREVPNYERPKAPKTVARRVTKVNPPAPPVAKPVEVAPKRVEDDTWALGHDEERRVPTAVGTYNPALPANSVTNPLPKAKQDTPDPYTQRVADINKEIDSYVDSRAEKPKTGYQKFRELWATPQASDNQHTEDLRRTLKEEAQSKPGYGGDLRAGVLERQDERHRAENIPILTGKKREDFANKLVGSMDPIEEEEFIRQGYHNTARTGTGQAGDIDATALGKLRIQRAKEKARDASTRVSDEKLAPYAPKLDVENMQTRDADPTAGRAAQREYPILNAPYTAVEDTKTGEITYDPHDITQKALKLYYNKKITADDVARAAKEEERRIDEYNRQKNRRRVSQWSQ